MLGRMNRIEILLVVWIVGLVFAFMPKEAGAGAFELSSGFSFSRSNYTESNFNWSRRWGFGFGYYFSEHSELEFAFQDAVERTKILGYEDTTFHDQIYSLNWVQGLLGKNFPIQPYIKIGIGQLNRDGNGTYLGGITPPLKVDSLTGVLGAGLRLYLTKTFGIRFEGTSYLAGGSIKNWEDNIALSSGISYYF